MMSRLTIAPESAPLTLSANPMTEAQLRVLAYLPQRLTYGEIADRLAISRNTVKTHAIAIYRKLGVSSRSAAITVAADLGFFDGPDSEPSNALHIVPTAGITVHRASANGEFVFLR